MTNAIISLAILKVNWDHAKENYLQSFVPFLATLMSKKNIKDLSDIRSICNEFAQEWGFYIPYHPMLTLVNYARKKGFIQRQAGSYVPVQKKVREADFRSLSAEQERKATRVINAFMEFSEARYGTKMTKQEAEVALMAFLKDHDLDILFASEQASILPGDGGTSQQRFLINSYVREVYEADLELFSFIVDMALGHMLASALIYKPSRKIRRTLKRVVFYLDAGLTMGLLGADGKERKIVCEELLKTLRNQRGTLRIFRHNYEEVKASLENARVWIDNPRFDPSLATKTVRNLRRQGYKQSDVDRILVELDSTLRSHGIKVVDSPDPDYYRKHQIDETDLENTIIGCYRARDPNFQDAEKEDTINKDVSSISAIYRLRQGHRAINVGDSRCILVVVNRALALASRLFDRHIVPTGFSIPACITDIFLGTFIWLRTPAKAADVTAKKIIADAYAALQPSQKLVKLYLSEIERLREENKIDDNKYYLLRTHRVACDLLQEKTMGDPDNFSASTPDDVYSELETKIRVEEQKKYVEEKERHAGTSEELAKERTSKDRILGNIERVATRVSNIITFVLLVVICGAFVTGLLLGAFPGILVLKGPYKTLLIGIAIAMTFFGSWGGFSIKWLGARIRKWIKKRIVAKMTEGTNTIIERTLDEN